jgi:hypothetical protein
VITKFYAFLDRHHSFAPGCSFRNEEAPTRR